MSKDNITAEGLSREEFLVLQEQLIDLKNRNYELQEVLKKKNSEIASLSSHSPRNEALQFASKLMNRVKDKDKELVQKYETEINLLRQKLATQEEEFRLQQETLISELNKVITQSESVRMELDIFKSQASSYASPQAGTPCGEPSTVHSTNLQVDLQAPVINEVNEKLENDFKRLTEENIRSAQMVTTLNEKLSDEQKAVDKIRMDLHEKELFLHAVEDQLLEYKQRLEEAESQLSLSLKELAHLNNNLEESQLKVTILVEDLRKSKELLAEKDDIISNLNNVIEVMGNKPHLEYESNCELSTDIVRLKEENIHLSRDLSVVDGELIKLRDDNKSLSALVSDKDLHLENLKAKLLKIEDNHKKERVEWTKKMTILENRMQFSDESHRRELEEEKKRNEEDNNKLIEKISDLEVKGNKEIEDRALLLETRYQLELSDREKTFDSEREVMRRRIYVLEALIAGKDEEKALALKKQSALIKELQRAVKEERKRADSLEKGRDDKGWHVVGESDARSNHTLDGNESVSSASALESDNTELINRLTALQKTHAETLDKLNMLEDENSQLRNEVGEKNELIEHWIRTRPIVQTSGTPQKPEGAFRKFLSSTLTGDDAVNDIKEMNKKLQRMLEETLSKNILLQRDLQTLLERTEL